MSRHYLVRYAQTGDNALREELRGEHIGYRRSLGVGLNMSGPLLDDDDKPIGSVVIIAAKDRAGAEAIAAGDPFVKAGLLTLSSIEPIRIASMKPPAPAA